jgi:hypothetical protein
MLSGYDNPKIVEHFMKRVKEFLKLPENTLLPLIILGDADSVRNLAEFISRLKSDIKFSEERINVFTEKSDLKKNTITNEGVPSKASPGNETPSETPDATKSRPKM